jgi:putative transposase
MFRYIVLSLGTLVRLLRARRSLLLENLALRQQLAVLKRRHPKPRIALLDKLFWVAVCRFCSVWKPSLIVVTPATVVRWHRAGFRLYWRLISRTRTQVGRRPTSQEVRGLIFRMVVENPTWGATRIHGELLMLGFDLSERTISRWMKRATRGPEPAKRWLAFLRNHRETIAAMDFFAPPTITFGVLYCFFVIHHDRRRILHFNVTKHPTSSWIIQQLREAFPFESTLRFLIFDRDAKYGLEVSVAIRSLKMGPVRTSCESPWQNGVAERWVESCRHDLLDHVIALNERHLKRLLSEYVRYYHEDRTHLGLGKGTPNCRNPSRSSGRVLSQNRLGGLHHRYDRAA